MVGDLLVHEAAHPLVQVLVLELNVKDLDLLDVFPGGQAQGLGGEFVGPGDKLYLLHKQALDFCGHVQVLVKLLLGHSAAESGSSRECQHKESLL